MSTLKRFGVSLEEDILLKLDNLREKHKFPNRSQAIRFIIQNSVVEDSFAENKDVCGAIVLIYDHHKGDFVNKFLEIQHDFSHIILATQHVHLDHHNCLETISLKGKSNELQELSRQVLALKGIKHGKLVVTSV